MNRVSIPSYLKSLAAKPLYYMPNGGNAGDALIAQATYQMLGDHQIEYEIVSPRDDLTDQVVAYGGGGNVTRNYDTCTTFIRKHHRIAKKLVLLPHTIERHKPLLRSLGGNVDLICRELVSHDYVAATARNANVLLADDLAFDLDVERVPVLRYPMLGFLSGIAELRGRFSRRRQYTRAVILFAGRRIHKILGNPGLQRSRTLNCFRTDEERTALGIPKNNLDLSILLGSSMQSEKTTRTITAFVLWALKPYDVIRTNRLHMCIAGILLGKKVEFYPNSYYKNKAVWDFSMRQRYPNVTWVEQGRGLDAVSG